jgi:hypothetical protein
MGDYPMRRFALCAFTFAWMAACETPPSAPTPSKLTVAEPSFAQLFNNRFPVAFEAFNQCPPEELVAFEGFVHSHAHGDVTDTSSDIKFQVNWQGVEGVGLVTGSRYSAQNNIQNDFTFSFPPPVIDQTTDQRLRMIRQGSDDNLWVRVTFRFTFPPGNIEIIRSEIECRG